MLVSLAWLNDFVGIGDLGPGAVADRLTMVGLEVERIFDFREYLGDLVAARLARAEPFGDGARVLFDGGPKGTFPAFSSARDLAEGRLYAIAPVGARLPLGAVKPMSLQGEVSRAKLVSAKEIFVGEDDSKALELPAETAPGTALAKIYPGEDWILEVSVTPNRGDALSHLGLARDLAAILNRPLKNRFFPMEEDGIEASEQIKIAIDCPEGCYRYCGRVINGASPQPSPLWLAARLQSLGLRSINNIVDVTNYVMLELGLPLHAFDLNRLRGAQITARFGDEGTHFTTLDGQERVFRTPANVLICDGEGPVAVGGVMGGLNSEVTDATRDVFLEGAMFNPASVRRTAKGLGLSTDASFRFERGQDINMCPQAVDRAASLISSLTLGKVAPGLLDARARPYRAKIVAFSPRRCNALLGTDYAEADMARVLGDVGVRLREKGESEEFDAEIPSWRLDIGQEADLFEEVVRLLDFANLPATLPPPPRPAAPPPPLYRTREKLRSFWVGRGFSELMSLSFINRDFADKLELPEEHPYRRRICPVLNPLSEEQGVLRTTLVPSLLNALRLNQYHGQFALRLFEAGAVFWATSPGERPLETERCGALWTGDPEEALWCEPKRGVDFFDLKGLVEALAGAWKEKWDFARGPELPPFLDPREAALVGRGGESLGYMGLLKESVARAYGLKKNGGPVYLLELSLEKLPAAPKFAFQPFSPFPGASRDLAVAVDLKVTAGEIQRAIWEDKSYPLASLALFDVFSGDKLPPGKKSLAFRLFFQDGERTLTEELVSGYFNSILKNLETRFGAALRA
ncbi:MAG: phenylalanine--tRNA ligase subunit beta [Deltaproteobacteria bacterium]|jgi:phenylalanyl-tRNA synthetase beta chain|nr:phenylalanine--tRNA ligase subunit beta [Deltaproteobacteria bacterium]